MYHDLQRCLDEAFAGHGKIRTLIDSANERADDESLTNPSSMRMPALEASPEAVSDNANAK